jgi:uncharacterized protein (TIGR02118 family)
MLKVIGPALRHPTNRPLADFHTYWGESHGPLFANTRNLRRYVQHLTLPEAYGAEPAPTFDGVSMFWFDALDAMQVRTDDARLIELLEIVLDVSLDREELSQGELDDPEVVALFRAVLEDDSQLFDRSTSWPMHHKSSFVIAEERVIVDGRQAPGMVKAIFIVGKLPGLTLDRFLGHWHDHHGPLTARVPGLRRYVQNHAVPEAYAGRGMTHDGWSELWFDDLASLQAAVASPEWQAARESGASLFAQPIGVGVGVERVQREFDWTYDDWGVGAMSEDEIRARLEQDGYASLASDPAAPGKIAAAAARQCLAVWTREHLVTIDESGIDARPDR